MSVARLATEASPTVEPFCLTLSGAKLLLKSYFVARRAGITSAGEIALYAHLTVRALKREADWVQISTEVLARELDVTERTLTRWLGALTELGWIERRSALRSDGTREIARTRIPALTRTAPQADRTKAPVTTLEAAGQGGPITVAEAQPVIEALRFAPELRAVADPAMRERIRGEIVFGVLRCALSRLPDVALRINVARKKLRQRAWKTPRTMPSDFHACFARIQRELAPPPVPVPERVIPRVAIDAPPRGTTASAAQHLAAIAAHLGHPTHLSEKELLLGTYPRSGCSATPVSRGVP
jgi:hypothetical protein